MTLDINVIKRNGSKTPLDMEKIHKMVMFACEDLAGVYPSQVEMNSGLQFFNGISSKEIQDILIKSAADLISLKQPNYQYVAARLLLSATVKEAFGSFKYPTVLEIAKKNVELGVYDKEILELYSEEEFVELEDIIQHKRDLNFTYAGLKQVTDKYLIQDRSSGQIFETPQFMYLFIAATLFAKYPSSTRLKYIKKYYDAISNHRISLPTPILGGLRTPIRQFSSCFPAGQLVTTATGLIPIEQIAIGDRVLTHNNVYRDVLATREKDYSGSMVLLNTVATLNGEFKCTVDHKLLAIKHSDQNCIRHPNVNCLTSQGKREACYKQARNYSADCSNLTAQHIPQWYESASLNVGDFVNIPYDSTIIVNDIDVCRYVNIQELKYEYTCSGGLIRCNKYLNKGEQNKNIQAIPTTVPLTDDLMYLFGVYLAEGSIIGSHEYPRSICLTFGTDSFADMMLTKCEQIVLRVFGVNAKISSWTSSTGSWRQMYLHSAVLAHLFQTLLGRGYAEKKIPSCLMMAPPNLQKELLRGVIHGDGHTARFGIVLTMGNYELIHQLVTICLRNKLFPNVLLSKARPKKCEAYTISLPAGSNREFIKWVDKKIPKNMPQGTQHLKCNAVWLGDKYFCKITGKSTEQVHACKVYDLQVDVDESFVVHGVASHNCVLISVNDTLNSIFSSVQAVGTYTAMRAGIGLNIGRIRALGSKIRGGEVEHTGIIPFLKVFAATTKSCQQSGIRGGGGTVFFPIWHYDIQELMVLKNNKGAEDSRIHTLDYGVQLSKIFYQRYLQQGNITLFSPHDVPDLYEVFFDPDRTKFDELYLACEKRKDLRKKTVKAVDLLQGLITESFETGRVYIMNVDHVNTHSPFLDKIYMSNLCTEVVLPATPIEHIDDEKSEIALCTLSALNLGKISALDDLEELADLAVRALDELLDYQSYPVRAAAVHAPKRRSLGIGYIGMAHYLAKNKVKYGDPAAWTLMHDTTEAFQFYLLKASCNLAKEKGRCEYFNNTTYSKGILPIDTYKKDVDSIVAHKLNYDWEALRCEIVEHGLRNSTLSTIMPSESSSVVSNETSGIEPPRGYLSVKKSKKTPLKQIVPGYSTLKNHYTLAWDMPDNLGMMNITAVIQKFIDQAISVNLYYDPQKTEGKVSMDTLMKDFLYCYKIGSKTRYYVNTNSTSDTEEHITDESQEKDSCEACVI